VQRSAWALTCSSTIFLLEVFARYITLETRLTQGPPSLIVLPLSTIQN